MAKRSEDSRLTIREAAHAEVEDFAGALERADERLARTLRQVPLLDHLADWRLVLLAGAFGLVLGGLARLVLPWLEAVAVFLVAFAVVMLVMAGRRTGD